jgi:hypothetical protein
MSVSSIQLLLFACAVELTLLALLTQSTFRPVAMLLMIVASISFTIGISWEVIPVRQPLISQLSPFANSPRFWFAAVGLIAVTVLIIRAVPFAAGAPISGSKSKDPST